MSRSYKKHMGGSYCGDSDKYSRSVYHRSKRRSDKKYCYEFCKKYEIQQIFERESNFCLECMLYTEELCSGDWAYCPYQTIDDLPTDKIVAGVDYSCRYADKWSWASDGGSFLMETESSLRTKFNSEVFGLESNWRHGPQNIWQRYQERNREIAIARLENRIIQALVIPKKRIKTKPTRASKERKLKLKKIRSEIKKNRGKIW